MLKASIAEASRSISISVPLTRWILNQSSHFHSSSRVAKETPRKRAARLIRKNNEEKKAERERFKKANAPHTVLGTRPGDDAKWLSCDLAKCLITRETISSTPLPVVDGETGQMQLPEYFNYGIDGAGNVDVRKDHLKLLFEDLPIASALPGETVSLSFVDQHAEAHMKNYQTKELPKIDLFARLVDLRNSNAAGLAFENRRRIIASFSEPSQPFDPGRTEVQVALITMKIRNLWDHITRSRKDFSNHRALRQLVHQRAKMLKYLKRVDRERYMTILERVGLEPQSVEGELIV